MILMPDNPSVDTAVIIAAGKGSRLADHNQIPKPLRRVAGLPLLVRLIKIAAHSRMKRVVVVVGFEKQKIIHFIKTREWPLDVEIVENDDFEKSNGVSLLAARHVLNNNFILMMSDHIFDPNTLKRLLQYDLKNFSMALAIDRRVHDVFDLEDATKVLVEKDQIRSIGKDLTTFNAIDTGLFLMSPDIFQVLKNVYQEKGDSSLSDGVRLLADQGRASVFDIGDAYWQDVDNPAHLVQAEKVLLNACRKTTDGIISKNFNRPLSLAISSFLMNTSVTANMATFFIILLGILTGYLAYQGTWFFVALSGICFHLTSVLDGVDGELSKLKMTSSQFGQWFDTISDNLSYIIFFICLGVGLYRQGMAPLWLVGMSSSGIVLLLIVMFAYLLLMTNSGSLLAIQADIEMAAQQHSFFKLVAKIQLILKRDFFAMFFMVLCLVNRADWILWLVAIFTHVAWIFLVIKLAGKISAQKNIQS